MNQNRQSPIDFIGIGTPRSGTTWLAQCLDEHPEICVSKKKERGIFEIHGELLDDEVFSKNFAACNPNALKCTFPVRYFYNELFIEKLKELDPDIKIIIMLRNPLRRIDSELTAKQRFGKADTNLTLQDVLSNKDHPYNKESHYASFLPLWLKHFSKEQIFIGIHEDSLKNNKNFLKEVYSFIGVDADFTPPSAEKKINKTHNLQVYNLPLARALENKKFIGETLRNNPVGKFVYYVLEKTYILKTLEALRLKNRSKIGTAPQKKKMDDSLKNTYLTEYENDITFVEKLIGRELPSWREV